MSESEPGRSEPTSRIDRVLDHVRDEPLLWPLALVVIVHVAAFVAPALLWSIRERRFSAMLAVAWLVVVSGASVQSEWQRKGGPGTLSVLIGAAWVLSVAGAWGAHELGVF